MVLPRAGAALRRTAWNGAAALALGAVTTGGANRPLACGGDSKPLIPGLPALPSSWEELGPIGGGISIGSLLGFCSGFALKKTGKAATAVFGGIFCLQQGLAYQGYITVNWDKVEKDLTQLLDVNKDGKVDVKDLDHGYAMVLKVLQHNAYSVSGGFGAGFLYGIRKG
mmetsp:Transcript_19247/g.57813  ORF Transcript_19247/g.57813 Transcript_19247/m.57813 type:complete len:168 (+) Transcript_19247:66-569(+)|eukprot:CAMPEP_0175380646 /NCGR_PEP_ID=MMETSP0095-20121207/26423_1 /TAXON_ID=311494 /ORGANISM="Alexandrium monilatum, Strain CCMP3105" /LENGTH=167 /DNA_ID=CAMNT_0016679017 /DNA_START=71 /DNA_END=574 /DNA_ORIENTATION=+